MANKSISQARINQEIRNLQKEKLQYLHAAPLQSDMYTWHFTFRGPENTDFHQGIYHGQIYLPFQYPFKPPDMIFLNSNGRFLTNTKICLTITQYHPQEWNSAWTIRTMLEAVISLFNEKVQGLGYVKATPQARRFLAKQSQNYSCPKCGPIKEIIKPRQKMEKIIEQVKKSEENFKLSQNKQQIMEMFKKIEQTSQAEQKISEIKPPKPSFASYQYRPIQFQTKNGQIKKQYIHDKKNPNQLSSVQKGTKEKIASILEANFQMKKKTKKKNIWQAMYDAECEAQMAQNSWRWID